MAALVWALCSAMPVATAQDAEAQDAEAKNSEAHELAPESLNVRLRLVWGGGSHGPQTWKGEIKLEQGVFADFAPLGVEADEAAALRISHHALRVAPIQPRSYDGCDVTIRGDRTARLIVMLAANSAATPRQVAINVAEVAQNMQRHALDDRGTILMVERTPGDRLRVAWQGDRCIFEPGETWRLTVLPDMEGLFCAAESRLDAQITSATGGETLWRLNVALSGSPAEEIPLEIPCPELPGAYRLQLSVRPPESLSRRLMRSDATPPLTSRLVEFAVVASRPSKGSSFRGVVVTSDVTSDVASDVTPEATSTVAASDQWTVEAAWDPSSPNWRQKIPDWVQLPRLTGAASARTLGNVKPAIGIGPNGSTLTELPPSLPGSEPQWQAYPLTLNSPGEAYSIEIALPEWSRQHLVVCLVEPDAAGWATSTVFATSFYQSYADESTRRSEEMVRHRLRCWPTTGSPVLLVANLSRSQPAQYGEIRLLRRTAPQDDRKLAAPGPTDSQASPASRRRLAAAYVPVPQLAKQFGGGEDFDENGKLSVTGWRAFYESCDRLVRTTRESGCNALVVSIAADGGCLASIQGLGVSPRFDTRNLGSDGPDPESKDVLEMMLRMCDAAGLTLIPALSLSSPLPCLESTNGESPTLPDSQRWVGEDGQIWAERQPNPSGRGAYYNLLNEDVQKSLADAISQLTVRYGGHESFGGVALQIDGQGYGVLPGLRWGMDDETMARFSHDTGSHPPGVGSQRFLQRAEYLTCEGRALWTQWRADQVTKFYGRVAAELRNQRDDLLLVLCLENALSGHDATIGMRQAVSERTSLEDVLLEAGLDLTALSRRSGVVIPRPQMFAPEDTLLERALDMRWNHALEIDDELAGAPYAAHQVYYRSQPRGLPSFDAISPFGADRTRLLLDGCANPFGDTARQPLVSALAERDALMLLVGGTDWMSGVDDGVARLLELYQQLPGAGAETHVLRQQPLTLRIFRTQNETTVVAYNESPWPLRAKLPLACDENFTWQELAPAHSAAASGRPQKGRFAVGDPAWGIELEPYDVAAWRFSDSRRVRVGKPLVELDDASLENLQQRIAQIESRIKNLNVHREFPVLQNAGFETVGRGGAPAEWLLLAGLVGKATVDDRIAMAGTRSLHLSSRDGVGVAVQSKPLAMPETGQLLVRAYVRTTGMAEDARLQVLVEFDANTGSERRYTTLGSTTPIEETWSLQEFAVEDLPLSGAANLRLSFFLSGIGEVWIDEVQLVDLHIAEAQCMKILRDFSSARNAMDARQVVDCLQLIDDYWSRFVVEYVPPVENRVDVAAQLQTTTSAAPTPTETQPGLRDRVREFVPRIFR